MADHRRVLQDHLHVCRQSVDAARDDVVDGGGNIRGLGLSEFGNRVTQLANEEGISARAPFNRVQQLFDASETPAGETALDESAEATGSEERGVDVKLERDDLEGQTPVTSGDQLDTTGLKMSNEILATVRRIHRLLDTMGSEDREDAVNLIEKARESLLDGRKDAARVAHEEMKDLIFYVEES